MPFTLTMPKLSPTMEEGTITKWCKQEGEFVKAGEVLFEVATDKATVEHTALDEGYLRKILVSEGKEVRVNQAVAIFTEKLDESFENYIPEGLKEEKKVPVKTEAAKAAVKEETRSTSLSKVQFTPEEPLESYTFEAEDRDYQPASPLAKKLAREKGLDLGSVKGSGPAGRVMSRDLPLAQPDLPVSFGKKKKPEEISGSYEEIPLTPMRKKIAERLQAAKTFIPHFYVTQEIDATSLFKLREELGAVGLKVTYNDLVVRASALALRDHPEMNSGYNDATQKILRFKTIDISIAVTVSGGLITPVVRYADFKNLGALSAEIRHLADLAKKGKLKPEEYKGGSFTISNMGMFGVKGFIPIINPPQAAILGVGGIRDCALVKNGAVVPGKGLEISLACDHRVIDGTDAAKFIKAVQKLLENPSILLV